VLTDGESVERGYGPDCAIQVDQASLEAAKVAALDQERERWRDGQRYEHFQALMQTRHR
jgi:hypothetical protein